VEPFVVPSTSGQSPLALDDGKSLPIIDVREQTLFCSHDNAPSLKTSLYYTRKYINYQ